MRCFSCGAETSVLKVEPQDFIKVRGFDLYTIECPICRLVEKRLTFNQERSRHVEKEVSAHPNHPAPSFEAVLGKIGDSEVSNKIAFPQKVPIENALGGQSKKLKENSQPIPESITHRTAPDQAGFESAEQLRDPEPSNAAVSLQSQPAIPPLSNDAVGLPAPIGSNRPSLYDRAERSARNVMRVVEALKSDTPKPPANAVLDIVLRSTTEEARGCELVSVAGEHPKPETKSDLLVGEASATSLGLDDEERMKRLRDMFGKVRAKIRRDT